MTRRKSFAARVKGGRGLSPKPSASRTTAGSRSTPRPSLPGESPKPTSLRDIERGSSQPGSATRRNRDATSPARPTSNIQHPTSTPPPANSQPPPAPAQRDPDPGHIAVGRVLGPFGLKGEMKVQPLTDNAARFKPRSKLFAGAQPVSVASVREASGHLYLTFKGYPDRDAIERFRHAILQIPEDALPPLPEGEYYRFQLIGLTVVDSAGTVLGTLDEIIETGANDVYRVHPADGADILLPALDDVILGIDIAAKRMTVDPPDWR